MIVYLPLQFPLDLPDYSLLTNIALGCLRHVFMLAKALSIYSKLRSTIRRSSENAKPRVHTIRCLLVPNHV